MRSVRLVAAVVLATAAVGAFATAAYASPPTAVAITLALSQPNPTAAQDLVVDAQVTAADGSSVTGEVDFHSSDFSSFVGEPVNSVGAASARMGYHPAGPVTLSAYFYPADTSRYSATSVALSFTVATAPGLLVSATLPATAALKSQPLAQVTVQVPAVGDPDPKGTVTAYFAKTASGVSSAGLGNCTPAVTAKAGTFACTIELFTVLGTGKHSYLFEYADRTTYGLVDSAAVSLTVPGTVSTPPSPKATGEVAPPPATAHPATAPAATAVAPASAPSSPAAATTTATAGSDPATSTPSPAAPAASPASAASVAGATSVAPSLIAAAAAARTTFASSGGDGGAPIPVLIGALGVALFVGLGTTLVMLRRRSATPEGDPP